MPTTGHPPLLAHLQGLLREGALPFDRFMQACLYEPGLGYYARSLTDPGRSGDFYTSVSTGPVFGRLLADHIADLWSRSFSGQDLVIVEQGAHGGQLSLDILDSYQKTYPDLYRSLHYRIIEPQPALCARQEEKLNSHKSKIVFFENIAQADLKNKAAFFLSNELLDSFPVKLLAYARNRWTECFVVWDETEQAFAKEWRPVLDPELLGEIAHWSIPETEGYQAEICPAARTWMKELAENIGSGFILSIDYGFTAAELYSPGRPQGTLSCYSGHQRDDDPLQGAGEKDITTHINFSVLEEEGERQGWKKASFQDQHHALIGIAAKSFLPELEETMKQNPRDPAALAAIRQFQTLTHPGFMGTQFKFLLQAKGISNI